MPKYKNQIVGGWMEPAEHTSLYEAEREARRLARTTRNQVLTLQVISRTTCKAEEQLLLQTVGEDNGRVTGEIVPPNVPLKNGDSLSITNPQYEWFRRPYRGCDWGIV